MTTDPHDGRPVRSRRAGATLVPGLLAWQRLGTGHRTETWRAWSTELWAPVVVKLPRPDQVEHPRARDALRREAECLAACPHPGLPRLLADRRSDDPPHLVLEWIDGAALDETDLLPVADVLALAAALTAVLRRLHHHGVAHLDLKPANVMIRDGWPILIDLGSVRPLGHVPDGPVGSPGYTAPELEAGRPVTVAADLYGLGAVLRDSALPESRVDELVARLLAADPVDRPRSADDVLAFLAEAAGRGAPVWPPFAERRRRALASSSGR